MKEPIINKKIPTIMVGLLFIGGVVLILGIFRAAKNIERPLGDVYEDQEENIFVYGAQAYAVKHFAQLFRAGAYKEGCNKIYAEQFNHLYQ